MKNNEVYVLFAIDDESGLVFLGLFETLDKAKGQRDVKDATWRQVDGNWYGDVKNDDYCDHYVIEAHPVR